jgi:hypothetical protein
MRKKERKGPGIAVVGVDADCGELESAARAGK